MKIRIQILSKS